MKKKTEQPNNNKPKLEETYETEIEYMCPVRGLVKQKVKVKKYASAEAAPTVDIKTSNSLADKLDLKYSGLMLEDDSVEGEETE